MKPQQVSENCFAVLNEKNRVCDASGIERTMEMKAYLEYVRDESKRCFDRGLSALEASKQIDLGPYGGYRAPARLYMNVERAYRAFRNEAADAPWDHAKTFDAIRAVAKARRIEVEF